MGFLRFLLPWRREDVVAVDEGLLERLEHIGQIKNALPFNQRGWCNILDLYVQLRETAGVARLQAGGDMWHAQIDAWRDAPGEPWRVKKYKAGDWEALVEPTARIAEWLLVKGGLAKEDGEAFMRAVEVFQKQGRLELP